MTTWVSASGGRERRISRGGWRGMGGEGGGWERGRALPRRLGISGRVRGGQSHGADLSGERLSESINDMKESGSTKRDIAKTEVMM